jgi:methyl coenzyme M reductase subunit D
MFIFLAEGQWFSPGTSVSSTNKTDCQDITEILYNTIIPFSYDISTTKYMHVCITISEIDNKHERPLPN